MQLFLYEEMNKRYRSHHADKKALDGSGPMTFSALVKKRVEYLFN
jgi:hypothetical protein